MKHIASPKRIKSKTVITKSKKKDQIIVDLMKRNDERMNVFFEQLFQKLPETFQEISSNLWKALVFGRRGRGEVSRFQVMKMIKGFFWV